MGGGSNWCYDLSMSKRLIGLLIILGVALAFAAGWLSWSAWLSAGKPERESVLYKPTRESINYEVFKPALFLFEDVYFLVDGWIDWLRPSHLQQVGCEIAPSRPEGLPFSLLRRSLANCYRETVEVSED